MVESNLEESREKAPYPAPDSGETLLRLLALDPVSVAPGASASVWDADVQGMDLDSRLHLEAGMLRAADGCIHAVAEQVIRCTSVSQGFDGEQRLDLDSLQRLSDSNGDGAPEEEAEICDGCLRRCNMYNIARRYSPMVASGSFNFFSFIY